MILAIDIDGTMFRWIFLFMPGARAVLQDLIRRGFKIIAVTRRPYLLKFVAQIIFIFCRLDAIQVESVGKDGSKAEKVKGCWGFIDNEADNFTGIEEDIHVWLFSKEPHPTIPTVDDWNTIHRTIIEMV